MVQGLGEGTFDQLTPFQTSTRVAVPLAVVRLPTAMHETEDVHEMPFNWLLVTIGDRAGAAVACQSVPFQLSANA
jgi:hypothetical protein